MRENAPREERLKQVVQEEEKLGTIQNWGKYKRMEMRANTK